MVKDQGQMAGLCPFGSLYTSNHLGGIYVLQAFLV